MSQARTLLSLRFLQARPALGARVQSILISAILLVVLAPWNLAATPPPGTGTEHGELWILIDTSELTLSVMLDAKPLRVHENIAIGSNGATLEKYQGDEKTPLGSFGINEIRVSERFELFLSLNYPTMVQAEQALSRGHISSSDYHDIQEAWNRGIPPPQNTNLGGHLGIHGLGRGSLEVHQRINWTNGCIGLTNEQISQLAETVRLGTRVEIR